MHLPSPSFPNPHRAVLGRGFRGVLGGLRLRRGGVAGSPPGVGARPRDPRAGIPASGLDEQSGELRSAGGGHRLHLRRGSPGSPGAGLAGDGRGGAVPVDGMARDGRSHPVAAGSGAGVPREGWPGGGAVGGPVHATAAVSFGANPGDVVAVRDSGQRPGAPGAGDGRGARAGRTGAGADRVSPVLAGGRGRSGSGAGGWGGRRCDRCAPSRAPRNR